MRPEYRKCSGKASLPALVHHTAADDLAQTRAVARCVVAAGTLVGVEDEASAVAMLAAIDDLYGGQTRGRTAG